MNRINRIIFIPITGCIGMPFIFQLPNVQYVHNDLKLKVDQDKTWNMLGVQLDIKDDQKLYRQAIFPDGWTHETDKSDPNTYFLIYNGKKIVRVFVRKLPQPSWGRVEADPLGVRICIDFLVEIAEVLFQPYSC